MVSKTTLALLASALPLTFAGNYTLTKDYNNGTEFFESFSFFTGTDPTNGFVEFLDETTANSTDLAGYVNTSINPFAAFLGVDTMNVTPNGRPALRLFDKAVYNHALFVVDISHIPYGCGVWPAFWLLGTSSPWPASGEIDIIEGVNTQSSNRMTLHTNSGVSLANASASMTGNLVASANCDVAASSDNEGCAISDPESTASYGKQFNENAGGLFATEYTSEAIKIWFFPRGDKVPADILSLAPNPSGWGMPNALFKNAIGDLDSHFCELQMIFDVTFCGDWAGNGAVWAASSECAALADTCTDYVKNSPQGFTEAYWAINSLRVYQDPSQGLGTKKRSNVRRRGGAVLPS